MLKPKTLDFLLLSNTPTPTLRDLTPAHCLYILMYLLFKILIKYLCIFCLARGYVSGVFEGGKIRSKRKRGK